jgi:hypothetical protein
MSILLKQIRNENAPLVVSMETSVSNENCNNFIKSLQLNDWDYEIIGAGLKWNNVFDKIILYHSYLKTVNPEKLIVLSDSRDVFCVRPPLYFKEMFQRFSKPLVVCLELFCQGHTYDLQDKTSAWQSLPINKYFRETGLVPGIRKYVNSGLIAGKAKDILDFLEWTLASEWKDDQIALCDYTNTFPDRVAVDIDATLLHTSGFGVNIGLNSKKQWYDSPSLAELSGRLNFFLHLPGITESIGQKKIYDTVKHLILDKRISSSWLHEGYSYPPPFDKGYDEAPKKK